MNSSETTPRHPIRVVAQRTGLTPATIRAWERRYAAVTPGRSEGGQRLYSDTDVTRLTLLKELASAGRPISMVAELSEEEARELLREDRSAASERGKAENENDAQAVVDRSYAHVIAMDSDRLERLLWRSAISLDGQSFLDDVIAPLLERIGDGWVGGEISPGQEHLASDVIDRILARLADPSGAPDGPALVVATLPGERHGLGARLVSAAATVNGWRVAYLGTDLPVADIVAATNAISATAVAISVVSRERLDSTATDLARLRELVTPEVEVLVGGRGALMLDQDRLPRGVSIFSGLEGLRVHRRNNR
jgi:MerR family transcriptional regulator, light-induced transcriptional regulator